MGAGLTGDFGAIEAYKAKLKELKKATAKIAKVATPKLTTLVSGEFSAGAGPYGKPWQAKKDGGAPFAGSDAAGRVRFRLISDNTLRVSVAFPMHFHQLGTKSFGKKTQKRLRAVLRGLGAKKKEIAAGIEEARVSLGGGQRLPAREIIPTDAEGIPSTWERALQESAVDVMKSFGATPSGG